MATKGSNPTNKGAKQKGEWKSETIQEWNVSKAVTWKAQRTTAPDGKVLIGVRQYITTAKMGEIAGKQGITFPDDDNLNHNLDQVMGLLEALRGKVKKRTAKAVDLKPIKKIAEAIQKTRKLSPKAQAIKDEEDKEAALRAKSDFVFVRDGNVYLKSCRYVDGILKVKSTEDGDEAQTFALKQATFLGKKLSSKWSMQEI